MTPFDKAFALDVMYPAAVAAYTVMTPDVTPVSPPGFVVVGAIQADSPTTLQFDQAFIANRMLRESRLFGLVLYSQTTATVLVTYRGTQTSWEWVSDLEASPVPNPGGPGDVHAGFELVYELCARSVFGLITQCGLGVGHVLITGHSLGAAVAVLAALDLANKYRRPVRCYTWEGPRVGTYAFQTAFDAAIPDCWRIVNAGDIVPKLPAPPLYRHVGQEQLVHGPQSFPHSFFSPHVAHALTSAYQGVVAL